MEPKHTLECFASIRPCSCDPVEHVVIVCLNSLEEGGGAWACQTTTYSLCLQGTYMGSMQNFAT
jgi:hypothetical protein